MDEELMRSFICCMLNGVKEFENALNLLLKYYEEEPLVLLDSQEGAITLERIRDLLMEKVKCGKSDKVREIFSVFGINKLSELQSEHYEEVFQMVNKI